VIKVSVATEQVLFWISDLSLYNDS